MRIRPALFGTFASMLVAGGLLPACGKQKDSPGLMLVFSSDMSVPKDVSAVGLYIRTRTGTVLLNQVEDATIDPSGNRTVRFPATFAVLSNGSPATVRIQLVAYGTAVPQPSGGYKRKAIVMRESTTGVPTDRLSKLRMPLLWINQGSAPTTSGTAAPQGANGTGLEVLDQTIGTRSTDEVNDRPEEGLKSPCGENQAWIGGKCRAIDPTAPLPEYTEADAPGSDTATCFNVEQCFGAPASLLGKIADDGTVDIGSAQPTLVNLALITKDQVGIKLPDGRYAISLDSDSEFEGFTITKNRIVLSEAVREALKSGRAVDLVATTQCAVKTPDVGNCGPWNPAPNIVKPTRPESIADASAPDVISVADGGKDAEPMFDGGPDVFQPPSPQGEAQSAGEPKLMGLALDSTTMYSVRDGMQPQFDTSLRFFTKGTIANPAGINSIPTAMASGATFRTTYLSFGATGTYWQNKSYIAVYGASGSNGYIYMYDILAKTYTSMSVPTAFLPVGVIASTKMPIFFGPRGVTPWVHGYTDLATDAPAITFSPSMNPGETPTALVAAGTSNVRLGTSDKAIRNCTLNGPETSLDCSPILASNGLGVPVDLAEDGILFALLVRDTGSQNNDEGIYEVSGGNFTPRATRANNGLMHFYPAGSGAAAATGPLNHITLPTGKAYGFATSAPVGSPSQVFRFDRTGATAPVPVATDLFDVRDIASDATHVYYTDFGVGAGASDGRVYRVPNK